MDFKYPYTDFHELNLDWFLAEFKKLTAEWLQVQHDWEDEQQAFQDLHDYVQNYFANLNLYQEVHDILYSDEMQQTIQLMLSNITNSLLPTVVANQIASVVASQLAPVVAAQLPNLLNGMLPSFLPDAVAGEAAAWLAANVDPATGYVIDKSLTIGNAAADSERVGNNIYPLIENGIVNINCLAHPLQGLSSINNVGSIGTTANTKHFSTLPGTHSVIITDYPDINKIVVWTDHTILEQIRYVFRDYFDNNIGSVITITTPTDDIYEISIPTGAEYFNIGFIASSTALRDQAINSTKILSNQSFFAGKLDSALTNNKLPAEGKAVGDRLTPIETKLSTSNVEKLRIMTTPDNVNFVARTSLTNLFVGYGCGTNTDETTPGDDGKYNLAIGVSAFNHNTSGDHCTAVGYCALRNNETGDFNTTLGEDSLYSNIAGSYNVAIGSHAGQHSLSNKNTFIGSGVARYVNNIGDDNIAIGYYALGHADGCSNNIAIGNNNLDYTTTSNQISIGDSTHTDVIIAGKKIKFNADGTVTWE